MNKEQYERWSQPLREHPQAAQAIIAANKFITYLCYVIYPILVAYLFITANPLAWKALLAPAAGFVVTTILRKAINEPRPYETLGIQQIINKDKPGQSFPSRHTYSVFAIAMTFLAWCAPVGIIMLVFGCCMACIRVLGGVHFPHDVIVGALLGIAFGLPEFLV